MLVSDAIAPKPAASALQIEAVLLSREGIDQDSPNVVNFNLLIQDEPNLIVFDGRHRS
jgi:hypothetical protein